ncbi:MAG: M3 family metallopeptidase [Gemmatimonadota bacterium]|nr:MAG: M3 family metallopeptidase [Gemmatimonadota bacterium]
MVGSTVCAAATLVSQPATPLAARHLEAQSDETQAAGQEETTQENPLLGSWETPFGVPPFGEIEDGHYLPAFQAAMAEHKAEIAAIVDDPEPPTFANTIEALERTGGTLSRVRSVFFAINSAHSNDAIREIARTVAPELAAHRDDIVLNRALYDKVKAVYDQRDQLDLTPEQTRLLEEMHKAFVRSGVNLEEQDQVRLREINSELAELSQRFGQNLLKETNDFELHVTDQADLGNLPQSLVAAAEMEARRRGHESGWSFTLQRPSINPFLQYSPNRDMRREVFMGYALRGDNDNEADNKAILTRMASLRAERAKLMGYESHAGYVLSDNMAENPERVYELLDQIWQPALRVAGAERDALQEMMQTDGIEDDLEGWDWRYYAEKVRKARYDLDEQALRPYFEVTAVRDGAFMVANKLFGLTFTELMDVPRWHPDQQVFEVREADGAHVGILYMDFFARESKRGGAWMNDLRAQSRLDGDVKAIVTTNFNFAPPTDDTPSLLSFGDAETVYHEFGHALHGLLSDVTYESLSGTNVPRDFVEFPSQIMEHWMSEPEVMRLYAQHYRTGETIPDELIDKIQASGKFNQGFATVEYLAASYLDMAWHTLSEPEEKEPRSFEDVEMARIGLIDEIIPRYRSTYFAHIFSGGYSAGYYSYIWAEVLDADGFQAFKETSLFDQETARRYRELVLAKGGTRPGMELYEAFRGRPPSIEPLLELRGLTPGN